MRDLYRLLAGFCAAALCLALVGCQNKQDSIEIPTSDPATAETAATPEQAAPAASALPVGTDATVLPQTPDAGRSYVDETLFIGDSNTARYMMYADEPGTAFTSLKNNIGVVSMGAGAITTLKCEQFKGDSQMYTIPDAVAKLKPKRIIICFGTNNLGGSSTDATGFISTYEKGLKAIVEAWPYADLIVSAIPPLDKQRENTNLTMTQVDAYNAALVEMCEANGYKFLNSAEVLRDDATGWAKKDYTLSDGVHLSKTAVTAYFEYVRTHAYQTEDRRPQPLGTIPEPDGVPLGLISSAPIAVRGAKVPVEFVSAGGGSISGSTSQLVKKGGTCSTVTAVPESGWKFDHWSASIGSAGGSASLTFTVPTNADAGGVVITAHFTPDAHDHDFVEVEGSKTAPGCETKGFVKEACSICGEVRERELDALGHDWDGGAVTKEAAPGVAGEKTFTCKRCGTTRTESIAALAVTPPPTAAPTPVPATPAPQPPTEAPHEHQYSEVSRTEPTCTNPGSVTYQCSCGAQYTEELGALGHSWDAGVETTPAQPGVEGVKTYTCTREGCGATYTEPIPALPAEPTAPPAPPEGGEQDPGGDSSDSSEEVPGDTVSASESAEAVSSAPQA